MAYTDEDLPIEVRVGQPPVVVEIGWPDGSTERGLLGCATSVAEVGGPDAGRTRRHIAGQGQPPLAFATERQAVDTVMGYTAEQIAHRYVTLGFVNDEWLESPGDEDDPEGPEDEWMFWAVWNGDLPSDAEVEEIPAEFRFKMIVAAIDRAREVLDGVELDIALWVIGELPVDHFVGDFPGYAARFYGLRRSNPLIERMFRLKQDDLRESHGITSGWWFDDHMDW